METHRTRNLILIGLILAAVIYILIPNNPGIHVLGINRDLKTQLGLDLRGGLRVLLEADVPATATVDPQAMADAQKILENRANGLGVSEVTFETAGSRRLVGEFPGLTQTDQVITVLKQVGQLAFVPLGSQPLNEGTMINVDYTNLVDPTAKTVLPTAGPQATTTPDASAPSTGTQAGSTNSSAYPILMTGSALQSVGVSTDKLGKPYISFVLKSDAAKRFADFTSAHTGEYLGIVLDGKVISSPVINSAITQGSGVIEGNFTIDSANALAVNLRYGSLPIAFKVVESQAVGATLGQDSIRKSEIAGFIGLLLVMIFMGVYYRLPGLVADLALLFYAAITFALFKLIPVTLTLPGIAGFVLSIGVAVDANVLIFSRLKEEMRAGRTLRQAIDLAWNRAWPSIRDSNISTLITCVILFWFGSAFGASIVQGFALTLALGVLVSLFTAIFATRTFLHLVLDNFHFAEHPRWFMNTLENENNGQRRSLNIIGRRYLYFAISLIVIIPGMIALAVWGLPTAIDYSGGSDLEVAFSGTAPQPAQVVELYQSMGVQDPKVQTSGNNILIIRSREISEEMKTKIVNEMQSRFGQTVTIQSFDTVGPTISKEVTARAAEAVGIASLGILIYITYAFRGLQKAYRYGIAAIMAMLHDVAVVVGMAAILGHFLHWEVDSLFLTALLTVIGFSVHDTIVVFDRIRENATLYRRQSFTTIVNHSIVQTLDRSINTQLTVMLTLLALALFGGITIHTFVVTLLIGVFSGTYSSIFNAAPILVVWENHEWRTWFHRRSTTEGGDVLNDTRAMDTK
jgi:protein-export membrane protein SecD/preprotein translocase SecF subunit